MARDRGDYHRLDRVLRPAARVCTCWDAVEDPTCKLHGYAERPSRPIPKAYKRYPPGKLPPHGTTARYHRGCKCIPCLDAKAKHQREKRRRRKGDDWVDRRYKPLEHGTAAGALRCKPRCDACRIARNEYSRELYARKRDERAAKARADYADNLEARRAASRRRYAARKLARDVERYLTGCSEAKQV